MGEIRATEPHYIRCIKPNADKRAGVFTSKLVHEQLRYSGVLEAIKIRKQGFPFRYSHLDFFKRYRCLARIPSPANLSRCGLQEAKTLSLNLVQALASEDPVMGECRCGLTMILYRASQHRALEVRRERARFASAATLTRIARGFVARIWARKLASYREQLKEAMATRDEARLDQLLKELQTIPYALRVAQEARALLERLRKERQVRENLKTAASWDPCARYDDLVELVSDATELGLERTPELIQVKRILDSVASRMEAIKKLDRGVRTGNRREIERAIAEVEELKREFGAFCERDEFAANEMLASLEAEAHVTLPVERSLAEGRIRGDVGSVALSAINYVSLERSIAELAAHAATHGVTPRANAIAKTARCVVDMRRAMASGAWDSLEVAIDAYSGVVAALGGASILSDYGIGVVVEEVDLCLSELHNHTIIEELTRALSSGMAQGEVGAMDVGAVETSDLQKTIEDVEVIGCATEEARRIFNAACLILSLRRCLRSDQWGALEAFENAQPTSGAPETVYSVLLKRYGQLSGTSAKDAAEPEFDRSRAELRVKMIVYALQRALDSKEDAVIGSVGSIVARSTNVKALKRAVDAASDAGKNALVSGLAAFCGVLMNLRLCVIKQTWGDIPGVLGIESELDATNAVPRPESHVQDFVPAAAVMEAELIVHEFCERKVREVLVSSIKAGKVGGIVGDIDASKVDAASMDAAFISCDRLGGTRTQETSSLMVVARTLRSLRAAVASDDWDSAEAALMLAAGDAAYDIAQAELELCQSELNNRTIIAELTEALSSGSASGTVGAFDASSIDTRVLEGDIADARMLGCVTDVARGLLTCSEVIFGLRSAVVSGDWNRGGGVEAAVAACNAHQRLFLESYGSQAARDEVKLISSELNNRIILSELSQALSTGRAGGTLERIDTSTVRTNALAEAIERARVLGCETEQAVFLSALAKVVKSLRRNLVESNWKSVLSFANEAHALMLSCPDISSALMSLSIVEAEVTEAEQAAQNIEMCKAMDFSLRVGRVDGAVGSLDVSHTDIAELTAAIDMANDMVPQSKRAHALLATCHAMRDMRIAVTVPDWKSAEAAIVNMDALRAEEKFDYEATKDEHMLVRGELRDRRLRASLNAAIMTGRLAGAPGQVDISGVDDKVLDGAVELTTRPGEGIEEGLHGVVTVEARQLVTTAQLLRDIRAAILEAPADDWSGSVQRCVDKALAMGMVTKEAEDEVLLAKEHAEDLSIVNSLRQAISSGGAKGVVGAVDVIGVVRTHALRLAVAKGDALGCKSSNSETLMRASKLLLRIREAQIEGAWEQVEESLESFHEAYPSECSQEMELAREEVAERSIIKVAEGALRSDRIKGMVGSLNVSGVKTAGLDECTQHTEVKGGCRTDVSRALLHAVASVRQIRDSVLRDDWEGVTALAASSQSDWGGFGLSKCPDAAQDEVALARDETNDRNIQTALMQALKFGKIAAERVGVLTDEIDGTKLSEAVEAAHRNVDGEGTAPAKSAQALTLASACSCVASLRSALSSGDFAKLRRVVDGEDANTAANLASTTGEYYVALRELHNHEAVVDVKKALSCGSARGTVGELDMSAIDVADLEVTMAKLRGLGEDGRSVTK